jgi:hypothetical protein
MERWERKARKFAVGSRLNSALKRRWMEEAANGRLQRS